MKANGQPSIEIGILVADAASVTQGPGLLKEINRFTPLMTAMLLLLYGGYW
jgi:hypothetical protein